MKKIRFVLASGSPRRIELLSQMGYRFQVVIPKVDETPVRGEKAQALVLRLAQLKAKTAARKIPKKNLMVLAADTCVVEPVKKRILGKPESNHEAARMLNQIQGRVHEVYTGYCLIGFDSKGKQFKFYRTVKTRVQIDKLSRKEILSYIRTREPMDKAGAYAAQGIGAGFIKKIIGSYTNVVGLPLVEVRRDLEKMIRRLK